MIRATLQSVLCLCLSPLMMAQPSSDGPWQAELAPGRGSTTPAQSSMITIPEGIQIPLVSLESISSATAQKGQSIRLAVARDVIVDGTVVIQRGARASGVIVEARKAIGGKRDGYVSFALVSLTLPDGSLPLTEYAGVGNSFGEDGWCDGLGSCLLVFVFMYAFYLPIVSVTNLFRRHHPAVSGDDQTKAACSPIWSAAETTFRVNVAPSDSPPQATEVDATCPMPKRDFRWVGLALQVH